MNQIGRKIYYDKSTGNVILDTGEKMGAVIETTIDQDITSFTALSERNRDTFDVIKLEYGQYAQDFAECNGYRVNVELLATLPEERRHEALEFSYPVPGEPDAELVFGKPLSEQVKVLENKLKTANERYIELDKITISLEDLKAAKIEQLKEKCTEAIYNGFLSDTGYEFGFNQHDQSNFTQQMLLIIADTDNLISTISWKTKNNGVIQFTKQEFLNIVEEAKQHKLNNQIKYWQLEAQVLSAQDKETVDSINW